MVSIRVVLIGARVKGERPDLEAYVQKYLLRFTY